MNLNYKTIPQIVDVIKKKYEAQGKKRIAFAPSYARDGNWRLSVVVADEDGHEPLHDAIFYGDADNAWIYADEMNRELGLTKDQAMFYVASSMQGSRRGNR